MASYLVDDAADPRLADYRSLTDVELRRRVEPAQGIFIAEGSLVVRRALDAGYAARSVLVSPKWLGSITVPSDVPVYVGSDALLQDITGFHVHRGALAAMARRPLPAAADVLAHALRVAVLEGVNTHTNVGSVFRCAAALGFDAVLLTPTCADPLYRRSVRVSMGAVFAVPYARLSSWDELAGFRLLALTPALDATPLQRVTLAAGDRAAVLLGAEGPGLSPPALAAAEPVRIPMAHGVDSLNVAAAAAVAFWALRRR